MGAVGWAPMAVPAHCLRGSRATRGGLRGARRRERPDLEGEASRQ